jgi:hypothetical protein
VAGLGQLRLASRSSAVRSSTRCCRSCWWASIWASIVRRSVMSVNDTTTARTRCPSGSKAGCALMLNQRSAGHPEPRAWNADVLLGPAGGQHPAQRQLRRCQQGLAVGPQRQPARQGGASPRRRGRRQQATGGQAQQPLGRGVGADHARLAVEHHHAFAQHLDHRAVVVFAVAQRLLRAALLGHVVADAEQADDLPVRRRAARPW